MSQDDQQLAAERARVLRDVVKARLTGRDPDDVQAERHAREREVSRSGRRTVINLDDVSNCPREEECAICGSGQFPQDLFVATISSAVGVYCTTLCPPCVWRAEPAFLGAIPVAIAVDRALKHCEHLGITADQMAAVMEQEGAWPGSR